MGTITHVNDLEADGIASYHAGQPEFDAIVKELFSDADAEKVERLLPYAMVIKNLTGRHLLAVTVLFSYPDSSVPGGSVTNRVTPSSQINDRAFMLTPNHYLFVTPVSEIFGRLDEKMQTLMSPSMQDSVQSKMAHELKSLHGTDVTVSLDSYWTEDGELVGPDKAHYEQEIRDRHRAQAEVYARAGTLSGVALNDYLTELATNVPNFSLRYDRNLYLTAGDLLDELNLRGEKELKAAVVHREAQRSKLPTIERNRQ